MVRKEQLFTQRKVRNFSQRVSLRKKWRAGAACLLAALVVVVLTRSDTTPQMHVDMLARNSTETTHPHTSEETETLPPWMAAYVDLHKSRVVKNADGALQYTNDPYLQWVCRRQGTCGGLGDRLNGIVMSLYVAMLTNRTLIVKGWQTPGNMTAFLEPALIRWDLQLPSPPDSTVFTLNNREHPYLMEPCKQHDTYQGIEFHNNLMTYDNVLELCMKEYWDRFGGRQTDLPLFHVGFSALFRFTGVVHERAEYLRRAAGMVDGPYVGVHVRTGQGSTFNDPVRHGSSEDIRRFYECAVKLQNGMKQRYQSTIAPSIYIAADNNAVKKQIHTWNSDAKFVSGMEVFHIDRTRTNELENVDQAYLDVWGELKVLIDSTCLVMSRSKFSFVASLLSPQQPRCAIMFDECSDANVSKALDQLPVG